MSGGRIPRRGLVSVACFFILTVASAAVWAQAAVDPQSLVGEWTGSWVDKREGKSKGQYSLTIEKVEGNQVHGRGEVSARRTSEFKFVGTLEGNRLTFGRDTKTVFTIEGTQMRGSSEGPVAARNISINKTK
jgi:hypothetical protein